MIIAQVSPMNDILKKLSLQEIYKKKYENMQFNWFFFYCKMVLKISCWIIYLGMRIVIEKFRKFTFELHGKTIGSNSLTILSLLHRKEKLSIYSKFDTSQLKFNGKVQILFRHARAYIRGDTDRLENLIN